MMAVVFEAGYKDSSCPATAPEQPYLRVACSPQSVEGPIKGGLNSQPHHFFSCLNSLNQTETWILEYSDPERPWLMEFGL